MSLSATSTCVLHLQGWRLIHSQRNTEGTIARFAEANPALCSAEPQEASSQEPPRQAGVNHACWFCMAHLQIKISGHPNSTPKEVSTYLSCTRSRTVLTCLSVVHGFSIRRGSVLSVSCYTQRVCFKYMPWNSIFQQENLQCLWSGKMVK